MPRPAPHFALAAGLLVAACTPAAVPAPPPSPASGARGGAATSGRPGANRASGKGGAEPAPLPPIPAVAGSLSVRVIYPAAGALITSRDSTYVLGSVGNGHATLVVDGQPVRVYPNGAFMGFVANPPAAAPAYDLTAVLGADTVHATHAVRVRNPEAARGPVNPPVFDSTAEWVRLDDSTSTLPDTDQTIVARPSPGDTYHWFLLPGTVVWRDGRIGGYTRVQLYSALAVWVPDSLTVPVDSGAAPRRIAQDADVVAAPGWDDFVLPVGHRPAYFVQEEDHALVLTLYGTRGNTDIIRYPTDDSLIRRVEWAQVSGDRVRYTLHLSRQPFGYLVLWRDGRFVLRVRRPPAVAAGHPLRGQVIAVDAGHPPGGATGPTGLHESDATLAVARRLRTLLEAEGAVVVMTRDTPAAVALEDRPLIARRADADAFVSIHLNAFPDGVNPFTAPEGSTTYYYYGQAEPLARSVQTGLVRHLGLVDQGIVFRSLAVARQTWVPSILCEGAFIIIPQQEAALRTAAFQDAYARGVAAGLADYFRGLGASR
jgi:N-acetylmuramoyl-L-alanine amidase